MEKKKHKIAFMSMRHFIFICFFLDSPAGYVCMYVCCPGGLSIFFYDSF